MLYSQISMSTNMSLHHEHSFKPSLQILNHYIMDMASKLFTFTFTYHNAQTCSRSGRISKPREAGKAVGSTTPNLRGPSFCGSYDT